MWAWREFSPEFSKVFKFTRTTRWKLGASNGGSSELERRPHTPLGWRGNRRHIRRKQSCWWKYSRCRVRCSANNNEKTIPAKNPDPGSQALLIDSLTQAFTSSKKTPPAIAGKVAELVDSMLVGGGGGGMGGGNLSIDRVKERAEKHSPPENCK